MAVKLGDIVSQAGDNDYRLMKGQDLDITQGATAIATLSATDIFLTDVAAAGTQASTGKVSAAVMAAYFAQSQDTTVELSDVSASGTADGQVLIYDNSGGTYTPALLAEGTDIGITNSAAGISIAYTGSSTLDLAADNGTDNGVVLGTDTLTISGTTNEIETSVSGDTITVGLPDNVTIAGNLTVSGTTVTMDTSTLLVEDKNITLANVSTPTKTTASGGGIQLESSAIPADWPEILWIEDQGGGNTDGTGTANGLTGWTVSNMHTSNPVDLPIAVMEFSTNSTAPDTNAGGVGSFHYDSGNNTLYLRTA